MEAISHSGDILYPVQVSLFYPCMSYITVDPVSYQSREMASPTLALVQQNSSTLHTLRITHVHGIADQSTTKAGNSAELNKSYFNCVKG